jgi:hypothetical protein
LEKLLLALAVLIVLGVAFADLAVMAMRWWMN